MTLREALDKLTPHLEDAADYVDAAGADAMSKLPKAEDLKASVPGALGALTGYGAGGAGSGWLAALLSKKISGKRSLPAIIASVLGGSILGGIGGRHAGEAIGDVVKSASMEKQALNPAQILAWSQKFSPAHVAKRLAKRDAAIDSVSPLRNELASLAGKAEEANNWTRFSTPQDSFLGSIVQRLKERGTGAPVADALKDETAMRTLLTDPQIRKLSWNDIPGLDALNSRELKRKAEEASWGWDL